MAHQPIANQPSFVNEQTNESTTAGEFTLADGFSTGIQPAIMLSTRTITCPTCRRGTWTCRRHCLGRRLDIGYNGSRGNHLDITSAPRATASSSGTDPKDLIFNYEQSAAYSKFNAGQLRLNKRLSKGISFGANYQYSHSIDNAGSVGGTSPVVRRTGRTSPPKKVTPASTCAQGQRHLSLRTALRKR